MASRQPIAGALPAPADEDYSFIGRLERRLKDNPPKLKSDRTRMRIRLACAQVLEEHGFHAARVVDVTNAAGLAEGSFYVYFRDKTDAATDVLSSMLDHFGEVQGQPRESDSPFAALRASNRRWIAYCRQNPGLMRCLLQLGDEVPEFAKLTQRVNRAWYERVARSVLRRFPRKGLAQGEVLFAVYALGSMMDEIARKLFVYPDPYFLEVLEDLKLDDEGLADAASVIWFKLLYPGVRAPAALSGVAERLMVWDGGGKRKSD